MGVQYLMFAIVIAFIFVVVAKVLGGSSDKAEEHKARMAEYDAKKIRYQDQHEEHEWKRAQNAQDEELFLLNKEKMLAQQELDMIRRETEIARREQEILNAQKALKDKEVHPDKYSDWTPKDKEDKED